MTGRPDRIQSKRGRNRLLRSSEKLVTRTLELLDKMYQQAVLDGASRDEIREATRLHLEVMSYIKPKLQAIAPAQLEEDGSMIALQVRRIAEQVEEQKLLERVIT